MSLPHSPGAGSDLTRPDVARPSGKTPRSDYQGNPECRDYRGKHPSDAGQSSGLQKRRFDAEVETAAYRIVQEADQRRSARRCT